MKKKHLAEIQRINASIPKELLDKLIKKELAFPAAKEIATRAQTDPNVSDEDKTKFKAMLDSGRLDLTIDVLDHEVEKQINDFLDGEFEKARKLGRLPPPQKWPTLKSKAKKSYVQTIHDTQAKDITEENK